jgi:hypothetical protein
MASQTAPQWSEIEIAFAGPSAANPYTDLDAWVIFTHSSGRQLRRSVFWDGGTTYRVRFASTQPEGEWQWNVHTDPPDHDLIPASGVLIAAPPLSRSSASSPGSGLCDGTPRWSKFLLCRRHTRVLGL